MRPSYSCMKGKRKLNDDNFEEKRFDGNRTLSENIADLAAMKAMVSIAESKGATNEDFKKSKENVLYKKQLDSYQQN